VGTIHKGVATAKISSRLRGVRRAQHQGEEEQQRDTEPGAACRQGHEETSRLPGFSVRTHPELFLLSHGLWNNDVIGIRKSPRGDIVRRICLKIISNHKNNQKKRESG
jgi:hypothetical protein